MIGEYPEFYFSRSKLAGPMKQKDIERIKRIAEILDQPLKDVAACYRNGEAMRCRFLVPSLPAKNETPDELSLASWPEWVDPDYQENDEEDAPWNVSEEERDTAEILIGDA